MLKFRSIISYFSPTYVLAIFTTLTSSQALANDIYDAATNQLYIQSVEVGNDIFTDVVITVGDLISIGGSTEISKNTYNLKTVYEGLVTESEGNQFSLKGTVNGVTVSGSGNQTSGRLVSSSFEGVPALAKTSHGTMTINVFGESIPLAVSTQAFYDSNYNYLGLSGDEYEVVTSRNPIPTAAKINDAGVLYTATVYTSSSKVSTIGTVTASYSITYETENSIILTLINIKRNLNGSVTQTSTANHRVTKDNVFTRISETSGDNTTFLSITF
ncbi:MAG: hypothetical protein ACSHXZ_08790 [Gammaproteobacteria bacterium]